MNQEWYQRTFGWIPRPVRRVIVLVIGCSILLLAVVGIVLPILPGWIFVPVALAIMAAEFAWAGRWLHRINQTAKSVGTKIKETAKKAVNQPRS
jgi:uncharacterized membrane protein YbaN (DUF454 family)